MARDIFTQWRIEGIALKLARDNGDPLYDKYQRYKKLKDKFKTLILKRYGKKAIELAKQNNNLDIEPWWD